MTALSSVYSFLVAVGNECSNIIIRIQNWIPVTERSGLVKAEPKRTQGPKRNKNARIEEDY